MKKKNTIFAAIVLLLVFMVGGAIAYFTDNDSKTNTFTIGDVDIAVDETFTAADGLNVMPGQTIDKVPTILNETSTNPAYVFIKLEVPCTGESTAEEFFTYDVDDQNWTEIPSAAVACTTNGTATHVYYYGTNGTLAELAAGANSAALFEDVTVINSLTGNESYLSGNKNIVITGYGIQTEGLASEVPATVWGYFA